MTENKKLTKEEQEHQEKIIKEYWKILEKRPNICVGLREAVKKSIINYDVKNEMNYAGDAWERMCRYKLALYGAPDLLIFKDSFDCDVAYLSVLQYAIAFSHVSEKGWEIIDQSGYKGIKYELFNKTETLKYRGDTMNSYAKTVHEYLKLKRIVTGKASERKVFAALKEGKLNSEMAAETFIRLNHTIGNLIPVPYKEGAGFNSPRGFNNSKINDYWDLTLWYIYLWYEYQNDEYLSVIVKSTENVKLCKTWLESFKTWNCFVEYNYLQDFVKDGKPKELWEGHLYGNIAVLPTELTQCEEFFKNASMWILARGERIAEAIMQKLEEIPECCPWKENNHKE